MAPLGPPVSPAPESQATPPQNKHLNAFEDDTYEMIRSIEFRNSSDEFQKQLASDITIIK